MMPGLEPQAYGRTLLLLYIWSWRFPVSQVAAQALFDVDNKVVHQPTNLLGTHPPKAMLPRQRQRCHLGRSTSIARWRKP